MNGTVAPPSSSSTAAATCSSRTPSSWAICRSMEVVTHTPVAKEMVAGVPSGCPVAGTHMDFEALILQPPSAIGMVTDRGRGRIARSIVEVFDSYEQWPAPQVGEAVFM